MRILVVNEYAGALGGVEQYLSNVVPALRRRGHQLGLLYAREAPRNVESFLQHFDEAWKGSWQQAWQQFRPEVLFLHRIESVQPYLDFPGPKLRYVHDHDLCCPRRHKYYWFNGRACHHRADWRCWLDLAFLRRQGKGVHWFSLSGHARERGLHHRLDRLLVGSRSMAEELKMNGLTQVDIVPPLVPLEQVSATPTPPSRKILYVGQLIRGKGVDLLLQALVGVQGEWQATLIGDGNARSSLEQQVRTLGLSGRVEIKGWVEADQLEEHFREAQMVAVPSRWPEPFGMVGLEAMHYGRPVIGFAHGGIPDWLEHGITGWLVPSYQLQGLQLALQTLLDHPGLCQQLGQQAQQRARERFAFEAMIDRLEGFLCSAG